MWRHGTVPSSRAGVPAHDAGDLPRRRPTDRLAPRPLDPAAESGLFAFLDENSGTFWAAYYAALATTSTSASLDALRRSSLGRRELPAAPRALQSPEPGDASPDGQALSTDGRSGHVGNPVPSDVRFGMPAPSTVVSQAPLHRRPSLFERPDVTRSSALPDCPACGGATEITFLDLDSGGTKVMCTSCATEVELATTEVPAVRSA